MATELVASPAAPERTPQQRKQKQERRAAGQPAASSLFRVIWRWHFYAGLIVSPLLMVVALTGGIYLFGAEITDFANRELVYAASTGRPLAYQALVDSAEAAVPGGRATRIAVSADPRRSVAVTVQPADAESGGEGAPDKRGTTVFVDPYAATVQGVVEGPKKLEPFFRVVREIHQRLLAGTTGRVIVELTTTWTIILLLSGLYLWWPRRREKVKGVWIPRWTAKPYTVLRDLHVTMGVYLLPVCLLVIITGLYYSLLWGESFHFVSKQFFTQAVVADGSDQAAAEGEEQAKDPPEEAYVAPAFALQQAVARAQLLHPGRDVTITLPSQAADHYQVSAINDYARGTYGAMRSSGYKLHRDSGAVLDMSHLADSERWWLHTWAYPLHVGSVWGPASKVLWLAVCLVLIAMPVTGLWMWWKRRPRGGTGFPRQPSLEVVPVWVWTAMVLLCLLLPVFGLSVLLIIIADWLLRTLRPRAA